MSPLQHTAAHAVIPATAGRIYAILVDYHQGHPQILPKKFFSRLEVEEGGIGEGTVIRVHVRQFGRERVIRMQVAEPEPGRMLTETDPESGLVTTFVVTPLLDGQSTQVTIATAWQPPRGIAGIFNRLVMPRMLRYVYAQELRQLAEYVAADGSGEEG